MHMYVYIYYKDTNVKSKTVSDCYEWTFLHCTFFFISSKKNIIKLQ